MKKILFLTADYANVTADGKINIMGIFNKIWAHQFPCVHPSFFLIIKIGLELGEFEPQKNIKLKLFDEKGKLISDVFDKDVTFPSPKNGEFPEHQIIIEFKGVPFQNAGVYQYVLLIDNKQLDKLDLHVQQATSEK